jgi:hypothetical protein
VGGCREERSREVKRGEGTRKKGKKRREKR